MVTTKSDITGHMIVRNEDQWVYFAIMSTLPYVKGLDIIDTGSSDQTVEIIKAINSPKIHFSKVVINTPSDLTKVRQDQLLRTTTSWFWTIDGDEIYPDSLAKEVVAATQNTSKSIIVVRRYDLLGDIYHRQHESVGEYKLYGESGHLLIRLINKDKFSGLNLKGDYPLEGYFDGDTSLLDIPQDQVFITDGYLHHAMYLKRSSLGSNLSSMFNRSKYKIERGIKITSPFPEIFALPRPNLIPDPLRRRSFGYEIMASLVTPIKQLKRQYFDNSNHGSTT